MEPGRSVVLRLEGLKHCFLGRRLNRFVVEVLVSGVPARALLTNTGRLEDLVHPGRRCIVTPRRPGGRTSYTLVGVEDGGSYAAVDTRLQSRVFEEAVSRGLLPWVRGCRIAAREPVFSGGRLDYLLDCNGSFVLVETKSAVLRSRDGFYAMYPDCPSTRGRRHVRELMRIAGEGRRALLVFSAALPRVVGFKPYWRGDPVLAGLIGEAARSGVDVRAYSFHVEETGLVILDDPDLPVFV